MTSRNFPACGSAPGRCWTRPVPPGGRRRSGSDRVSAASDARRSCPASRQRPRAGLGSPNPAVMSEARWFLVTFKNKQSVIIKRCLPLPQRGLLSWVGIVSLAPSSACESKTKRLGHHLLSSMPLELCDLLVSSMVACGVLGQDIWVWLLPCWIAGCPARNSNSPGVKKEEILFAVWKKSCSLALEVEVFCRTSTLLLTSKSCP